jgi:epoxyqueuosine reductase
MTLAALETNAQSHGLTLRAAIHPTGDLAVNGAKTVVLLGPHEPKFWPYVQTQPEFLDGHPHPMDRWSRRVMTHLATPMDGQVYLPSDGPPYPPFIGWALASDSVDTSPVGLLVHADAGLFLSFRGAISLPERYTLPQMSPSPCESCTARPCESACPVCALGKDQSYDVPRCKAHLRTSEGAACLSGCLVRRVCPASHRLDRDPAQSAFHMAAFLKDK